MANPLSPRLIAIARRLTAPDALEQMERTGRRRELNEALNGYARCHEDMRIGENVQSHSVQLTWSDDGRRQRERS